MLQQCVVCKNEVDWMEVQEVFEHLFERADRRGIESLTERQQVVVGSACCCQECYDKLA